MLKWRANIAHGMPRPVLCYPRGPPATADHLPRNNTGLAHSSPAQVVTKIHPRTLRERIRLMALHHDTTARDGFKGSSKITTTDQVILAPSVFSRKHRRDHGLA
jgi:hypothetical protein